VLVRGGRVTSVLARYLAGQLQLLRPGVRLLDPERAAPVQELIDLRRRDVLVAFDYRRYQADTVQAARTAFERGGTVVLFTDPWLSLPFALATRW
jgi:DNA-binding MurR/RpiR family transcriptional regulator